MATIAFKGLVRGKGAARRLVNVQSGNVLMAGHLFKRPANADEFFLWEMRRNGGDGIAALEATTAAIARGDFDDKPISPELVVLVRELRRTHLDNPLSETSVPQL